MIKYKIKTAFFVFTAILVLYGASFAGSFTIWDSSATVSWSPNTEPDLYGYKVYIGKESRNYTDYVFVERTRTSHRFDNLMQGQIYYFCVTSVNNSGVESAYSEEVSKRMLMIARSAN